MAAAEIVTIPCLSDNYAYLLHDAATGVTACIDVPEFGPIQEVLNSRGWTLSAILITHHHWDHVQDVGALVEATGAKVYGCEADKHRLPPLDVDLSEGDTFDLGNLTVEVLDVSGHCDNHLAFVVPAAQAAFTADSLMALGCGRLFEGTPEQMWGSLSKLAALPPETWIYSGHEYTMGNAAFAVTIEPENAALISRVSAVKAARARGEATVPSQLAEELATNPFLRAAVPSIASDLGMSGAPAGKVFAEIRGRKDRF